ncbi:MAG: hypothetical protein D3X82_14640 [Candidatus Leucobacter sulfamidivorax]|nr:hypothetical protein [Candidatus Leucobacter sulfamidivorax]
MTGEPQPALHLAPTTTHAARKAALALQGTRWEDEARRLQLRLQGGGPTPPVLVVAGETGRGKSTLVNALLGRPEASPTGRGGVTALPIVFAPPEPGSSAGPGTTRLIFDDGGSREIPAERLADWACSGGAARHDDAADPPRSVLRVIDDTPLPGITVIDTPGAGGHNPVYARAAIAAAGDAGVLLVVTDAGGRLTAPALGFVKECARGVDHAIVAMNGIDTNRSWPVIAEENRELLAQALPGIDAEVVGVSALRGTAALSEPDEGRRGRLWDASGVPELLSRIADAFARGHARRAKRALGEFDVMLAAAHREAQDELEALSPEEPAGPSPKERLKRFGEAKAEAEKGFTREAQDLWDELTERLQRVQFALTNQWVDRLGQAPLLGLREEERLQMLGQFKAELEFEGYGILTAAAEGAVDMTVRLFAGPGLVCPPSLTDTLSQVPALFTFELQPQGALSSAAKGKGLMRGGMYGMMVGRMLGPYGLLAGGVTGLLGGATLIRRFETPKLMREEITRALQECFMHLRQQLNALLKRLRYQTLDEFRDGCDAEAQRLRALNEQASREAAERGRATAAAKSSMSDLHTARQLLRDEAQRLAREV